MTDLPPPVTRPNGKVYRPRKPPRAVEVDNDAGWNEPSTLIYVLGTHDIERAFALAQRMHRGADKDTAKLSWARLTMRRGEGFWEYDDICGAATVIFGVIE